MAARMEGDSYTVSLVIRERPIDVSLRRGIRFDFLRFDFLPKPFCRNRFIEAGPIPASAHQASKDP